MNTSQTTHPTTNLPHGLFPDEVMPAQDSSARVAATFTTYLQSPYLRLVAAGSEGKDSVAGVHLRWSLDGFLGQQHIPKGKYSTNQEYFNKPDDYVFVKRALYSPRSDQHTLYFSFTKPPSYVVPGKTVWAYVSGRAKYFLHFADTDEYRKLERRYDPILEFSEFLKQYGDRILELEVADRLSFAVNFLIDNRSQGRVESFSISNKNYFADPLQISARINIKSGQSPVEPENPKLIIGRILAENIKKVRFCIPPQDLTRVEFEVYDLFLEGASKKQPKDIGQFSLTLDSNQAFNWLEDTTRFDLNKEWARFNDGAFVKTDNYFDRWSKTRGLKEGVDDYIQLSATDPLAIKYYAEESIAPDGTQMGVSLQNYLNIASMDYHVARMLGMGYIDTEPYSPNAPTFIYIALYQTHKHPEDFNRVQNSYHIYLSLPTSVMDYRLPQTIELLPLRYGLTVDNGTETPLALTDAEGYLPYERIRFIRLRTDLKTDYSIYNGFFLPDIEFQSSDFTSPVFTGIEHRKDLETSWRQPELEHDPVYTDSAGFFESRPVYFSRQTDKPTFIHQVKEEGIDVYAAYPINVFSRAADHSNSRQTDPTRFRRPNTLRAPTHITSQLIQAEDPLLLTSAVEQNWLKNIDPDKKEILCRITFDYYHLHDLNYGFGNYVEIYHKKNPPVSVIGSLTSVSNQDTNIPECNVYTDQFRYESGGQIFTPVIAESARNKFLGGLLTYKGIGYRIAAITSPPPFGEKPVITLKKNETREAVFVNGSYQLQQVFRGPLPDNNEGFLIVENLAVAANWEEDTSNLPVFRVDLGRDNWGEHSEIYIDDAGNEKVESVKGIWDTASISQGSDQLYRIQFENIALGHHPQYGSPDNPMGESTVEWYKGIVRVHVQGDITNQRIRKELKVEHIVGLGTGNLLEIVASDEALSSNTAENIQTGSNIVVNFHPGYRVYLRSDEDVFFDQSHILPVENQGARHTLIGLRTLDTLTFGPSGEAYASPMSVPSVLMAREIKPPKQPRKPIGLLFATPPDFYNKATYSFETEFDQKPWAIVYYRADIQALYQALYKPETIALIKSVIGPLKHDERIGDRWGDLLSFNYSGNAGEFTAFPAGPSGTLYTFPNPDRPDAFPASYSKPGDVLEQIKAAIYDCLLPLTEQPLLYQHLKTHPYVPQPGKQTISDRNGKILPPNHVDFKQSPMAKLVTEKKVLFTDFTLDSNVTSETAYFYVVREMSNSLQLGAPSSFLGPIQLHNTRPPASPVIKRVKAEPADAVNGYKPRVLFDINAFAPQDEISSIRILRSEEVGAALSTNTMSIVKETPVDILTNSNGILTVEDDFNGGIDVPYGVPLYYRIIGIRTIPNNNNEIKVMSAPSSTLITNIMDVIAPPAPRILIDNIQDNGSSIEKLNISWTKVCVNGVYTIWFLQASGAWEKIHKVKGVVPSDFQFELIRDLPLLSAGGRRIFYKVKITVENSSGIASKESEIVSFPE